MQRRFHHAAAVRHPSFTHRESPPSSAGRPGSGRNRRCAGGPHRSGFAAARRCTPGLFRRPAALVPLVVLALLAAPGTAFAQQVTFSWSADPNPVAEDAGTVTATLTATLTAGTSTAGGVVVVYSFSGRTATGNTDYRYTGPVRFDSEFSFPRFTSANQSHELNLPFSITDDNEGEGDETFVVSYSSPGELNPSNDDIAFVNDFNITITIKDNDLPPPTDLGASVGDGSVTLSWAAVSTNKADDTAGEVAGYEYRSKESAASWPAPADPQGWTSVSPSPSGGGSVTVTDLTNGTSYDFEVRAVDDLTRFNGTLQVASVTATPLLPTAPTGLSASDGVEAVTLSWDDPGNTSITGYQYRHQEGDGAFGDWVDVPGADHTTTSHTVTGLTEHATHTFQLRAVAGDVTTPEATASAYVGIAVTIPARTNCAGRAAPDPELRPTFEITSLTRGSVTDLRLVGRSRVNPWQQLFYQMRFERGGDTTTYWFPAGCLALPGTESELPVTFTDHLTPGGLLASPGDGEVILHWEDHEDSAIERHQLRQDDGEWTDIPDSGSGQANGRSYTIGGLTNGTEYRFQVRAVSAQYGTGAATAEAAVTPGLVPGAPTGVTFLFPGTNDVTLIWDDPNDDSITGYQYSTENGRQWKNIDTDTSPSDPTRLVARFNTESFGGRLLQPGNTYRVGLRALNDEGPGAPALLTVALVVPPAPQNLTAASGDEQVSLSWDAPGAGIDGYQLRIDDGTFTDITDADTTEHTVTGLRNGTEYTFQVRARNVFGEGEAATVTATPRAPLGERVNRVHRVLLPEVARTAAASTLDALSGRLQSVGAEDATYRFAGQESLYQALKANYGALESGTLTLGELVADGSAFLLPLSVAGEGSAAAGGGGLAVWGSSDFNKLAGGADDAEDPVTWEGHMLSTHLGADVRLHRSVLAGLLFSWSHGTFVYTDHTDGDPLTGDYESQLATLNPYLGWWPLEWLGLWATAGYGGGEIRIDDELGAGEQSSALQQLGAAAGVNGQLLSSDRLIPGSTTALRLKAEGVMTRVEAAGGGLLEELTVDAYRVRAALAGSLAHQLGTGGLVTPEVEVGFRYDLADGEASRSGVELGGAFEYTYLPLGVSFEARGRALLALDDREYQEWGVGARFRVESGAGGEGLALSVEPAVGRISSGVQRLWSGSITGAQLASAVAPEQRLTANIGYGFTALGGLLTPYGGVSVAGEGSRSYRLGGRFALGSALGLSLEVERRDAADGATDHALLWTGQLRY